MREWFGRGAFMVVTLSLAAAACSNGENGSGGTGGGPASGGSGPATGGGGSSSSGGGAGGDTVVTDPSPTPKVDPATVDPNPTNPKDDGGGDLGWVSAPLMSGLQVQGDRDSTVVFVPDVAGAKDYRVILLPKGTSVHADGAGEAVAGTTIFCAGYRQHAAPAGPRELLRRIEVTGIADGARMAVEAIDTACPFPGIRGATHHDFAPPTQDVPAQDRVPFAIYTDQEIIAKYGSLIINGHGPGATLASQAAPVSPGVLARSAIIVKTTKASQPPASTFFDDFDQNDQPVFVKAVPDGARAQFPKLYQSSKWSIYTYDAGESQMYIDRGTLRFVLNDWSEDVMSSVLAVPKMPAHLSSNDYLHITFEVQNDATPRRYWWLFLCGSDTPGATFDAQGNFLGNVIQTPFFMENDGLNPSLEGWNCFQAFTRDGFPFPLPPDDTAPETELRMMLNTAGDLMRDNVINPDPAMFPQNEAPPSWYRQIDANGTPVAPILDDQQLVAPRTRFDFYLRRDRAVMLVDGKQRACNDFPGHALTMAEAAVGFGQVFYHSSGERMELQVDYWKRTGKRYILENSPYLDVRTYDNVGFTEHVASPPGLDESVCYHFQG